MRYVAFFLITCLVLTLLFLWYWPDPYVHVIFCDVGQGDAILVTRGFQQVLIDGGPDPKVLECLLQFMPVWDRQLDLVVGTHADKDHIGGLPDVLASYQVKEIWTTAEGKKSSDYRSFHQAILSEIQAGASLKQAVLGHSWVLKPINTTVPAVSISVLAPQVTNPGFNTLFAQQPEETLSAVLSQHEQRVENYNDGSIVLLLEVREVSILLTGDAELASEQALLAHGLIPDVDVLKVGHHGSKTSTSKQLAAKARPEFSVISCGKQNRFGHPAQEVLATLAELNSQIWRTDQSGAIELITDGNKIWWRSDENTSNK